MGVEIKELTECRLYFTTKDGREGYVVFLNPTNAVSTCISGDIDSSLSFDYKRVRIVTFVDEVYTFDNIDELI